MAVNSGKSHPDRSRGSTTTETGSPPSNLLRHDLDDEADANPKHPVEQLRLGLNEHGQVDEQLLEVQDNQIKNLDILNPAEIF